MCCPLLARSWWAEPDGVRGSQQLYKRRERPGWGCAVLLRAALGPRCCPTHHGAPSPVPARSAQLRPGHECPRHSQPCIPWGALFGILVPRTGCVTLRTADRLCQQQPRTSWELLELCASCRAVLPLRPAAGPWPSSAPGPAAWLRSHPSQKESRGRAQYPSAHNTLPFPGEPGVRLLTGKVMLRVPVGLLLLSLLGWCRNFLAIL